MGDLAAHLEAPKGCPQLRTLAIKSGPGSRKFLLINFSEPNNSNY